MSRPTAKLPFSIEPFYPLIIALAVALSFGALVQAQFCLFDDPGTIARNPNFDPPTLKSIAWYWSHAEMALYIPVTYTAWEIVALASRYSPQPNVYALNPAAFHALNVAIHVLSALAVFKILSVLLSDRRAACLGALLFALHPVQVEAVAWASGTKDVLSGALALAALWQYLEFARNPARRKSYAIATVLFALATLAKPSAMVLPAIALAIDWLLIRRPIRSILVWLLPWFLISGIIACIAKTVQPPVFVEESPFWLRPFIAGDALAFYLFKLVWPFGLALDYGRTPAVVLRDGWIWMTGLLPAAMMVLLILRARRNPELAAAGLVFLLGVAVVLGIVPFQFQRYSTTADHYIYLSMLGPALACGWALKRFHSVRFTAAASGLVVLLAVLTMIQTTVWKDDFSLFGHALRVNPRSLLARLNLGLALFLTRQADASEQMARETLAMYPESIEAHEGLVFLLGNTGRLEEAIEVRKSEIEVLDRLPPERRGELASLYGALARELAGIGRMDEARDYIRQGEQIDANDPEIKEARRIVPPATTSATQPN